ncbi:MAG: hypothetical protein MJE77_15770 [Proteobacteria bacterium]|nr:hypothetical protein [Pseudomonadota bacterium]
MVSTRQDFCIVGRAWRLAVPVSVPLLAFLAAGCPASADEVEPPRDQLVFPTGIAVSPDESVLFVANANSELAHSGGSVLVVDLQEVDDLIASGNGACAFDPLVPGLRQCDESAVIRADAGVRIGNFATEIGVQELESGDLRLLIPVRGDPSLTWVDYPAQSETGAQLSCGESAEVFPQCGENHQLVHLRNDVELQSLIREPFGIYVTSDDQAAVVTHLSLANITLVDLPRVVGGGERAPPPPVLTDSKAGLFEPDSSTGIRSAVGIAGRPSGDATAKELMYVTSRSEARVQILYVDRGNAGPAVVPAGSFRLTGVPPADDARGIAFNDDGSRVYIVNRDPPIVHVYNTELGQTGLPKNRPVTFTEVCRDASNVRVVDVGRGDRVYVACFSGGQIWVLSPEVSPDPQAIIDVDRGPHALAVALGRKRLYVANVLDDTISVVDLTPGAETENRVVVRLGIAKNQEGGE